MPSGYRPQRGSKPAPFLNPRIALVAQAQQPLEISFGYRTIGREGAAALAATPIATHMRQLNLGGNDIRDEGVRALAESPHLSQLTHLNLRKNEVGPEAVRVLSALPALRSLDLSDNPIHDEGLRHFAASPLLTHATSLHAEREGTTWRLLLTLSRGDEPVLDASRCAVSRSGVLALLNSPRLSGLRHLTLRLGFSRNQLDLLGKMPHLRELIELDLNNNAIDPDAARLLAEMEMPQLRTLRVSESHVRLGRGIQTLLRAPGLNALHTLDASRCQLDSNAFVGAHTEPWNDALRVLLLDGNRFNTSGLEALLRSPHCEQLTELSLRNLDQGFALARGLAAARTLSGLQVLDVSGNTIGFEGARLLVNAVALESLKCLRMQACQFPYLETETRDPNKEMQAIRKRASERGIRLEL